MNKENIEPDYDSTLNLKFIERIGSPFHCDFPILGTDKCVKPIKDKKILVIRMEPCAELYALNNSVTYLTDNKKKYDAFLEKVNDEKFGSDDSAILFDDWKNIDKFLEENDTKFDVIIGELPCEVDTEILVKHCPKAHLLLMLDKVKDMKYPWMSEHFAIPGEANVIRIFAEDATSTQPSTTV